MVTEILSDLFARAGCHLTCHDSEAAFQLRSQGLTLDSMSG